MGMEEVTQETIMVTTFNQNPRLIQLLEARMLLLQSQLQ
jgi:hypothetical protein